MIIQSLPRKRCNGVAFLWAAILLSDDMWRHLLVLALSVIPVHSLNSFQQLSLGMAWLGEFHLNETLLWFRRKFRHDDDTAS